MTASAARAGGGCRRRSTLESVVKRKRATLAREGREEGASETLNWRGWMQRWELDQRMTKCMVGQPGSWDWRGRLAFGASEPRLTRLMPEA